MKSTKSIGANLNDAQVAMQNAKNNPDILALLTACGYDANKIKEGLALHKAAQDKLNELQSALGDQLSASAGYKAARRTARKCYQKLAKSCRALWSGDTGKLTKVGLNKPMPGTHGAFLAQAGVLFNPENYTKPMLDELSEHGYDADKFTSECERIDALDEVNQAHEETKGASRQASREFQTAAKALRIWTARFKKFARLALEEKPQLLEKLGIAVRTTKTKAQREAPAKAAATRIAKSKQKKLSLAA
jgi:hypothetical protein